LSYPVSNRKPINPYASANSELAKRWQADGWGALVIVEHGLEFDFLAWYRPLVICEPLPAQPTLASLIEPRMWLLRNPGTLTTRHASRMQFKSIGRVSIDAAKLSQSFPKRITPLTFVVNDISIANDIAVRDVGVHEAHRIKHGYPPTPRISALTAIAIP
jgi:hypothetical protein